MTTDEQGKIIISLLKFLIRKTVFNKHYSESLAEEYGDALKGEY